MFITRKRFQEEIAKAKKDAEEEIYRRQEEGERFRWVHERIDHLEKRIYKLECQLEHQPVPVQGECCEAVSPSPACY